MEQNKEMALKIKEQANELFKQKKFDQAIEKYSECIKLDENNAIFRNNRSLAYFQNYQFEKSLEDSQQAVKLDPTYEKAYIRNSQNLRQLNRVEKAIQFLENNKDMSQKKQIQQILKELKQELEQINKENNFKEDQQITQNMVNWLQENNQTQIQNNHIKIQNKNDRILIRSQNIDKDQTLVFIPKQKMITEEFARNNSKIIQQLKDIEQQNILPIFLLEEKNNKNSEWKHYLQSLPTEYSTNPLFFGQEELEILKGTTFLNALEERRQEIKEQYEKLCQQNNDFKQFQYEEYLWARVTVSSRQFELNIDDKITHALVPFADMMNHDLKSSTNYKYNQEKQGLELQSNKPLNRGDEITVSYGNKSNAQLFLNYGFTIRENKSDELMVNLQFLENDIQIKAKQRFLKTQKLNYICQLKSTYDEQCNLDFYAVNRYICLKDYKFIEELENIHEKKNPNSIFDPKKTPPVSVENEIDVWNKINNMCFQFFMAYPTSIEQDYKKLKSKNLSENERNIYNIIVGEKEILLSLIQTSQIMLGLLKMSIKELMQARITKEFGDYKPYINSVILKVKAVEESQQQQQE